MAANEGRIRNAGLNILVVSQARAPLLRITLKQSPLPFQVVGDPDRQLYRAFGLDRATWWNFLHPGTLLGYIRGLSGVGIRWPSGEEDLFQLGGDFVIDATGTVRFSYRSEKPTDRPDIAEIIRPFEGG